MADNVLYADLNLPELTRSRILTVPDVQDSGCTYAEVKVKSQDTNAAANCKSSGKSCCSRKRVVVLAVIILVLVLVVCFIITFGPTADTQNGSEILSPTPGEAPGKSCCSTTRVAVLVTEIILLLLSALFQIIPCNRPCSRAHIAVLVVVLFLAVLALTLSWTLPVVPTADTQNGSTTVTSSSQKDSTTFFPPNQEDSRTLSPTKQNDSTTLSPTSKQGSTTLTSTSQNVSTPLSPTSKEDSTMLPPSHGEAPGCPPAWKKHGRKCYFFSPEARKEGWNSSRAECTAMGSDLVIIESREELNYLQSQSRGSYYLLGLRYSLEEQKWKWINNMEHDPAMFTINGHYRYYHCTVMGFGVVFTAHCNGTQTIQNMCEKSAIM